MQDDDRSLGDESRLLNEGRRFGGERPEDCSLRVFISEVFLSEVVSIAACDVTPGFSPS